jgi:hypothetical protein
MIGRLVQRHRDLSADELLGKLAEFIEQQIREGSCEDRTLIVARRSPT